MSAAKAGKLLLPSAGLSLPPHSKIERELLAELGAKMPGRVRGDDVHRALYSTDASIYEVVPAGVAMPKTAEEMVTIVEACSQAGVPITARGAGTSLSGQTVGEGLIVDVGRYMTGVGEVDLETRQVDVQPGVILDNLNKHLAQHGLFFAPDTSTANRCRIGGMIGNNSCGSHSIKYGTTRDHLEHIDVIFSDGKISRLGEFDAASWRARAAVGDRLAIGMGALGGLVAEHRDLIIERWPGPRVTRRNTGYPLDELAHSFLGGQVTVPADLARFMTGTEGTLGLTTSARLKLEPLPKVKGVVAVHFNDLRSAFEATVVAVEHSPAAVELMDRRILDLAMANPEQARHSRFIIDEPASLLMIEFYTDTQEELEERSAALVAELKGQGMGYAWPSLTPSEVTDAWELRKAGLGVLMGAPGDIKPVTIVEDTAVAVEDLPEYIAGFEKIMERHEADCVYYAHASVGELHLRPELNLKDPYDADRAEAIAAEVADLVGSFRGALSGEHGDGRVRSPFLNRVLGEDGVMLLEEVKDAFDPEGIFNPSNIVRPNGFRDDWRYHEDYSQLDISSEYQYLESGSIQQMVERCNGAGVCTKTVESGGNMCPSYMATKEERYSTRGRANLFRHLIQSGPETLYRSPELKETLDLCLSCKACKSECPASVDMARLKGDFLQGWYDRHGIPLRTRGVAELPRLAELARSLPGGVRVFNVTQNLRLLKRLGGVTRSRQMPQLAKKSYFQQAKRLPLAPAIHGKVLLYVDELTDQFEPELGLQARALLEAGGWQVLSPKLGVSGRTWLSKGLLRSAKAHIDATLAEMERAMEGCEAIVGIEPSAALTFLDEAVDLQRDDAGLARAKAIADRVRLVDTFIAEAAASDRWDAKFEQSSLSYAVHGHCHQKSLVGIEGTLNALKLIPGAEVRHLATGCCGMAGSFGYEDEHYELSMKIGELTVLPAARSLKDNEVMIVTGTSCRSQVTDGASVTSVHPVTALHRALARA